MLIIFYYLLFSYFVKGTAFIAKNKEEKKSCRANTKRKHQKLVKKKFFIAARQNRFNSFKANKFMFSNLHLNKR